MPELAPLVAQAAERPDRADPGPDRDPAARHPPHPAGAHQRRVGCRLGRHLRRRHRPDVGAAHGGVGRRRAPHRARDQESADADPALGRAPQAPLPEADQGRPRDLLDLHRHHHPPGRRHRPHGRRVLLVRPHAAPDRAAGGRQGALPAGAVPAAQRQSRASRYHVDLPDHARAADLRPPPGEPGADQHPEERRRGDRRARSQERCRPCRRARFR